MISATLLPSLDGITQKILRAERLTPAEGIFLYEKADLPLLGLLANVVREQKNDKYVFYNRNIHIEPTNICIYNCRFCSYSKKPGTDGWEFTPEEMLEKVKNAGDTITEVHIVGGVHPDRDAIFYGELMQRIKQIKPDIHIKAFTAIELDFMIRKAGMKLKEGLKYLKNCGLDSIPGGGAEIFDEEIRKQICNKKNNADRWLEIHETAHQLGIPSNATILYGHVENYTHRIDHLTRLRELQDRTGGFQAFIPLKYRSKNNEMSKIGEVSVIEDMKNYAFSRIYLDNIQHIKAYWPMLGKQMAQLALSFGVDDMDGTINDTTKIYSLAGAEDTKPEMSSLEMIKLIAQAGRIPAERDSLYNIIKIDS
ncbi:MAG: aminofutalosine synthase MqnE [Lentimicrobiaceae bacterium]|nr:aminofutalosine synthase MqnE [Lentimicrobiaceae bacterium]